MTVNLKALVGKLNDTTRSALEDAASLCLARTHYNIEFEHLLLKLVDKGDSDFRRIASRFGLDLSRQTAALGRSLDKLKSGNPRNPAFSPTLMDVLIRAWVYGSLEYNAAKIRSGFVVIALVADEDVSRIVREASPEMAKIDAAVLRRDFMSIVEASPENVEQPAAPAPSATGPAAVVTGGPRVFISYRHGDDDFYADSLFDRLIAAVADIRLFRDKDTLKPGMVYSERIDETLRSCDILLAIIGKNWTKAADEDGARRLDKSDDWVRLEIASALRHGKTVVPCLAGRAKMPGRGELPADISDIALRQAISLSRSRFRQDTVELVEMLKNWRRGSGS